VLDASSGQEMRQRLAEASARSQERGVSARVTSLDPNEKHVRVFDVTDLDPAFAELITHPSALPRVRHLLADDFIVSDVEDNIAEPGSGSIVIHFDLAVVVQPPWTEPWNINVIWCRDDMWRKNGATQCLPGSHAFQTMSNLPEDMADSMLSFEAKVGSILAVDGTPSAYLR